MGSQKRTCGVGEHRLPMLQCLSPEGTGDLAVNPKSPRSFGWGIDLKG